MKGRGKRGPVFRESVPVEAGETYEVKVHGLGHSGEGVGRYGNFTLFVEGAIPGDLVEARVTEVKRKFGRAEAVEILEPSSDRVRPVCPHFENCGGCQLQHMAYSAQLRWKRQQVVDALERVGGLRGVRVQETLGMEEPYYYRNKAQYPVGKQGGAVVMGFFRKGTHEIVDLTSCLIEHTLNNQVLAAARRLIREFELPTYNEADNTGFLRHVLVRSSRSNQEAMVVLVTNGRFAPGLDEFVEALVRETPVASVAQNINERKTNVILGEETVTLWGKDAIEDRIGDLRFMISPRSFFQVNPVQTEVLYRKAVEYAELSGQEQVFDLYCGIGTISLFLARMARRVVGIDDVPEAIVDARKNAALNGIQNATFIAGKAEVEFPRLVKEGTPADVVVVDPPRAGCEAEVLRALVEQLPQRIVYVSCNPSTLARDLAILTEKGQYNVLEVQPVDMFPHTSHVECIVLIKRAAIFSIRKL